MLKRLRLQAGLSQEQLAERAHISAKAVGAYERGDRRAPYRDTLALIVEALGITGAAYDELASAADRARRRGPGTIDVASSDGLPHPNNLPIARTTFVGRGDELAEVTALLDRHRLLTLVGSGGVGKTRLATQVGAELLDRYPDGVWFVDFAPITDPLLVASITAQALGMRQQQGHRVDEAIPAWLKCKRLVLIFDNAEHVLETAASLADAILAAARDVHILATSRQALNISGEAVYQLAPLAVPAEAAGLEKDEALRYGAVALFADRAAAVDTRFILADNNAAVVAEICRRLDGIPLAIELAAARVKVLSISNLAQRLDERFKFLTGGSPTALPRQKTLIALIDWSYDLLAPHERLLFARIGIFAGGFGLDAVTAVCSGESLSKTDIFDLLASLTEKSLVVADTKGEHERYRLLESTAAYALEKLIASGQRERLARRHGEYFREEAEAADARRGAGLRLAWLAERELELDNYRAALEWALTQGNDALLGGAIAGALEELWSDAGLVAEGRYWIELALSRITQADRPAARLQLALGGLSYGKRKLENAELAMQLFKSAGDLRGAARAQRLCGFALYQMGRIDEAREAIAQALELSRAYNDAWNMGDCLNLLAIIEVSRGNLRAARELFGQALAGMKACGDALGAARLLGNMAELTFAAGDPAQALCLTREALELTLPRKHRIKASWHNNAAAYCIAVGDIAAARESALEALRLARQVGHEVYITVALQHLALLAALGDDVRCGSQLLGYVDARYDQLGLKRERTEQWSYDQLLTALRATLTEDEITRLATEGGAWSEDQAVENALSV